MSWVPQIKDGFDVLSVQLNAEQGFVLAFVDGENTLEQIAELTDNDPEQLRYLLEAMVDDGILAPEHPREEAATPPPDEDFPQLDDFMGPAMGPVMSDADPDDWEDSTQVDVDTAQGIDDESAELFADKTPADGTPAFLGSTTDEVLAAIPDDEPEAEITHALFTADDDVPATSTKDEEILVVADDDKAAEDEEEIVLVSGDDDEDEEIIAFIYEDDTESPAETKATQDKAVGDQPPPTTEPESQSPQIEALPVEALQEAERFPFTDIAVAAELLPVALLDLYGQLMQQQPADRKVGAALAEGQSLLAYALDPDPLVANALLANPGCSTEIALFFARYQRNPDCLHELAQHSALLENASVREALLCNPAVPVSLLPALLTNLEALDLAELAANEGAAMPLRQAAANLFYQKYQLLLPQDRTALLMRRDGLFIPMLAGQDIDEDTVDLLCQERYDSEAMIMALIAYPGTPLRLLQVLYR